MIFPQYLAQYLQELDAFIEAQILPLQMQDDNNRFFDYRREDARTDWERDGLPNEQWEELLLEAKRRADAAGHFRFSSPKDYGGKDGSNLDMAIIREHLAAKGLGLHNDLQNEHSIVGNNVGLLLMLHYGTEQQKAEWIDDLSECRRYFTVGITETAHGSDATHMETSRHAQRRHLDHQRRKVLEYRHPPRQPYPGHCAHQWQSGRRGGPDRLSRADEHTGFQNSRKCCGPSICPPITAACRSPICRCPTVAILGGEGKALQVVQHFFNENRIRQAASSLGAAQYCINESVQYALQRAPFGKPLSSNQGIQFPLVELQTQAEMLRALIHKTAWQMDTYGAFSVSDKISMCNFVANKLCCDAADQAMQVHGGLGYSRHAPFEHIYRHHRRYRITEGTEEIQKRRIAGYMFGFMDRKAPKGVTS